MTKSEAFSHRKPFSHILPVSEVTASGHRDRIVASEAERADLAKILGLPAIKALSATLETHPFGKDGLSVDGTIEADIVQTCVVTSEDFESHVTAPVFIRFSPEGIDPNAPVDLQSLAEEGEDPPDLLVGGQIDLGTIVTEFLALALDPYPRKPGVVFAGIEDTSSASPFASLAGLKKTD